MCLLTRDPGPLQPGSIAARRPVTVPGPVATRIIAAATARIVASQFVPRNRGIKATVVRKSMRTARMAKFSTAIKMNVGFSAG